VHIELSDGKVTLRRFSHADAQPLYEATRESLPQLQPWMRWCEPDFSLWDSAAWIDYALGAWERGEAYNYAILGPAGGRFSGSIWLSHVNRKHRHANLGYWVRVSAWGGGVGTAAARLLASAAFSELGLHRLEILLAPGNTRSERIAQKLGAVREGLMRQRLYLEGQYKDAVLYGLLAPDFLKDKKEG
jgi:ribosomal-protein-serine acetyltransferase